jgi:hypothetical protein
MTAPRDLDTTPGIVSFQWTMAVYCLLIGSVAMVAPHRAGGFFDRPDLRAAEGIACLLAGFALASAAIGSSRSAAWIAHLFAAAVLALRGWEIHRSIGGFYVGPVNHYILAAGSALAPGAVMAARRWNLRAGRDWLSVVAAVCLLFDSAIILSPPRGVAALLAPVSPLFPWFRIAFAAAGVFLLVAQFGRRPSRRFLLAAQLCAGRLCSDFRSAATFILACRSVFNWAPCRGICWGWRWVSNRGLPPSGRAWTPAR